MTMTNDSPANVVLRLRDDLTFTPQSVGGEQLYVVEDRLSGKCYRVGLKEYALATALDGEKNLGQVLATLAEGRAECSLTETEGLQVCRWLLQTRLVQPVHGEQVAPAIAKAGSRWAMINPIFIRIPLLSPDRLLERLLPSLDWINTAAALAATAILWLIATLHVAAGWERFVGSATNIFSLDQGVYLLLGWVLLKVLHELGHGLACKHYGGYVREAGVALLLLAPIPYVDVTSSWRLRSKWARIHIAAAGMIVEAIIAAFAALAWSYSPDGAFSQLCVNIVVMATATTLLFNANPLMRFDGYYMLTDLLELPNLYSRGQQFVSAIGRRWVLGDPNATLPNTTRFVRGYALASWVWRLFVCVSLICAAAALFHGAGVVIAAIAIFSWFIAPAIRLVRTLCADTDRKRLMRVGTIAIVVTTVGWAVLSYTPWPFPRRSPGIVEYEPLSVVRAESAGFLREILVNPGERVTVGQVLARLENPELPNQLELLELNIKASQLRCRMYRQRREMAAHQAEAEQLAAFKTQLTEKRKQVEGLSIRASSAGQIVGRTLPQLVGTYLSEGQELCRIGRESAKEIQLSVHQDDVESFQERVGQQLAIRSTSGLVYASLTRISPRATERATHPALCASHGGPLAVRQTNEGDSADQIVLLEPRFIGHVSLQPQHGHQLRAGQLCTASVRSPHDSIGRVLSRVAQNWIGSKVNR